MRPKSKRALASKNLGSIFLDRTPRSVIADTVSSQLPCARATRSSASWRRVSAPMRLTWPKSMRPNLPSGSNKKFPGWRSALKTPCWSTCCACTPSNVRRSWCRSGIRGRATAVAPDEGQPRASQSFCARARNAVHKSCKATRHRSNRKPNAKIAAFRGNPTFKRAWRSSSRKPRRSHSRLNAVSNFSPGKYVIVSTNSPQCSGSGSGKVTLPSHSGRISRATSCKFRTSRR
mmetsp:Transcript_44561/g.123448  ORF Transcript_44561/g.123448 Transcript_44561/m.123448 type:complete len:232 (-) Transcript_44561:711-1406(-)